MFIGDFESELTGEVMILPDTYDWLCLGARLREFGVLGVSIM